MAKDIQGTSDEWIFADADPGTLPTEKLPGHEELERYSAPLVARRGPEPARPTAHQETVDLSAVRAELAEHGDPAAARKEDGAVRREPGAAHEEPTGERAHEPDAVPAPLRVPTYARSGTTPNAEDDGPVSVSLPPRFHDLKIFDALRDIVTLICMITAMTTTFTLGEVAVLDLAGKIAIAVALASLAVIHALRWIPKDPPMRLLKTLRVGGMIPAIAVAAVVVLADLVLSLPVLFASLPDGPPVGVGVGVAMLLLGGIVGVEPRAHCAYLPGTVARHRSRLTVLGFGVYGLVTLILSLVMMVGRVFTTGWQYPLMAFGNALLSVLLLFIVLRSALARDRSWYVFSTAAVGGLVIAALADNTLRMEFAAPASVATGFVYLPILFGAWGIMVSRSFVRTMPMSFHRADWLVFAMRALEFSIIMHTGAVVWHVLAAITAGAQIVPGGRVLHLMDAVVCAAFVTGSTFARRALLERPAVEARATAVMAAVAMVVVGFLMVIVNTLASGAGAGLVTGAVALATGIAVALMLTVPSPVRDEFGAPDLTRMFSEFRTRNQRSHPLFGQLPDVAAERRRAKTFPRG